MAKRTKQQSLNHYSGPVERCSWPACDKQDDTFQQTRVGVLCIDHAWSVFEAVTELSMRGLNDDAAWLTIRTADTRRVEREQAQQRRDQRGTAPGWVYYIRIGDRVKIGYSADVKQRTQAYPPGSLLLAVHPGTPQLETDMHRRFAGSRAAGREWFRETPDLAEHIAAVVAEHGPPDKHRHHFRTDAPTMRRTRG